jgi:predicted MFS family arabinose efflux permease
VGVLLAQVGVALASYLGGVARDSLGDYTVAFLAAGVLALLAALMASRINRRSLPPAVTSAKEARA